MANEQETIADIVREMRDWDTHSWLSRCNNFIADLADLIEAVHNRVARAAQEKEANDD